MSKEKQIEEMEQIVSNAIMTWVYEAPPISNPHFVAAAIYDAGYRKQIEGECTVDVAQRAEVAREIFEEIDKRFEALLGFYPCNGEFEDAKGFVDFHWKYIKRSIMRDYDPDFEKKYLEADHDPA